VAPVVFPAPGCRGENGSQMRAEPAALVACWVWLPLSCLSRPLCPAHSLEEALLWWCACKSVLRSPESEP
jgi:hypothetical protein